ncbi:hypothetical protein LOTGIDRAFT_164890 [Lottia gigantea]|uniref:DUF3730 domain-containing protein n=1 Tax=Lottia gigantea TaxID=225164 RepID=V3ZEL9_LOTGI|nr:hypothetical protein LOTGIDRAFT_164890 [Lottia gigantea]ESO89593.1 hypothetical protein LOTGIDRAFT_164890 [Lottia gigantea]
MGTDNPGKINANRVQCLAIRILKPFLQFLFLEPQQTPAYQQLRHGIQEVLLGVIQKQDDSANEIVHLLVSLLPGLQIKTPDNLGYSLEFLTQIVQKINPGSRKVRQEVPCALLVLSFTIIKSCLKKNLHVITLLQGLVQMLECCQTIDYVENIILLISDLLMVVDYEISDSILCICKNVLERCQTTNQLTQSILILPLLQLLSIPTEQPGSEQIKSLTSQIISLIEKSDGNSKSVEKKSSPAYFTEDGHQTQMFVNLLEDFNHDPENARKWLQNVLNSISSFQNISVTTTNMVAALFVSVSEYDLKKLTLELLVEIAKADNSQAPNFLSLLLYELGRNKDAGSRLLIMEFVPLFARHKVCIGPILKTIQMFSTSIKLQPLAIRLMVHLWQIQDRCYPHLIKLVTEPSSSNTVIIAQALAIKEICHLRPEQHGEDLLAPVSDILNKCSDISMVTAAALALEALYMLCEAEVIDIKSAWNVLAVKLTTDKRPAVIEKICELFALVPNLAVDNPEYEEFMNDVVNKLWMYSQSQHARVQGAAYQALASYNLNQFYIDQLPKQVTKDIREEIEKKEKNKGNEDINYHVSVPSVCYIRILQSTSTEVLKDYGVFLSGIVGKEVDELPRGIYHSSLRRQTAISNQGKAISNIPAFILSEYEKTKQPGLRPSLAVSLLFCYDPPIEVGRDGRPRRHYIISHGKNYQQFFQTLLNEVPIQPSEWHRCMLLPQGWTSFVDRLYSSLLESRKVEIESQFRQGQIDEEEAKKKLSTNWLW